MDSRTLLLLAMAVAPVVAVIVYVYWKDKYDREPFGVLLVSFLWGCFSVVPAIILESILPGVVPASIEGPVISLLVYTFVIIALSEEASKFIFLRYYSYKKNSFNEPFDGIVYGVMVAMGFATIENLLYIFNTNVAGTQFGTAILRAFTAIPAHATFGATMGYYVGLAKFNKAKEKSYFMQGIVYAAILHGFYNFFLFQQLSVGLYAGAAISILIGLRFSLKAMRMQKENSPFKKVTIVTDANEKIIEVKEEINNPTKPS